MKKKHLKQVQNQAQDGRSMVEMLGVLAIIGVISLGGIAGYRWGMDKHVSNQILYEMNLNSAQLAMLLQKGNPEGVTLSLGSPYDDAEPRYRTVDYGFDYGCEAEVEGELHKCFNPDETGYFISALNLPERIANMVIESAPNLQYYVDYEETVADEVENKTDVTIFFDINADAPESLPDSEVTQPETTTTEPKPCDEFKQCDPGYFCLSNCSSCDSGGQEPADCTFICEKIGISLSKEIKGITYYYKEENINWWSAKRYCEALKAQEKVKYGTLLNLEELGCEEGKIGKEACINGELREELYSSANGPGFINDVWTTTMKSDDLCQAYDVFPDNAYVRYLDLNNAISYALCK